MGPLGLERVTWTFLGTLALPQSKLCKYPASPSLKTRPSPQLHPHPFHTHICFPHKELPRGADGVGGALLLCHNTSLKVAPARSTWSRASLDKPWPPWIATSRLPCKPTEGSSPHQSHWPNQSHWPWSAAQAVTTLLLITVGTPSVCAPSLPPAVCTPPCAERARPWQCEPHNRHLCFEKPEVAASKLASLSGS